MQDMEVQGVDTNPELPVYYAEDLRPATDRLPDQPVLQPEYPELPFEIPRD